MAEPKGKYNTGKYHKGPDSVAISDFSGFPSGR
jgi:hypothetical protein